MFEDLWRFIKSYISHINGYDRNLVLIRVAKLLVPNHYLIDFLYYLT